jgi:hypothetical protein
MFLAGRNLLLVRRLPLQKSKDWNVRFMSLGSVPVAARAGGDDRQKRAIVDLELRKCKWKWTHFSFNRFRQIRSLGSGSLHRTAGWLSSLHCTALQETAALNPDGEVAIECAQLAVIPCPLSPTI